ncbi:MAG: CDP-alcohol phosphatidyltransferase [Actinobacteria bacterium 13_2_20CM_2_71_6]|nr:MAG: CDP-alcohol phosphatidyltransferase [Actinobacteria bacterium 13_2_20CM_2_71_6]
MAKILSGLGRAGMGRVLDPVARALLRARISPDAVTVAGTVGVLVGAIGFGARGHFIAGTVIVTLSTFTDIIDGSMARQSGRAGRFGAFLDSTMDRVADGAVFGAVAYWLGTQGRHWAAAAALICLVTGQIVSYAKARAEGLGLTANVGVAERFERLALVGLGGLVAGFGWKYGLDVALWLLAALSVLTIWQRVAEVRRQDRAAVAAGDGPVS